MLTTTFENVSKYLDDVTQAQMDKCNKLFDPQGRAFYAVENERGDLDMDNHVIEYCVRYSRKYGFTCTCPSGANGFANVRHPSKVCKHCRWVAARVIEERAEAQARKAKEAETPTLPEWYNPANETSYYHGTRAYLLITGNKEADDATYARVMLAKPQPTDGPEVKRDMKRYGNRKPFSLM